MKKLATIVCLIFLSTIVHSAETSEYQDIYSSLVEQLFANNKRQTQTVAVCPFNSRYRGLEPFATLVTERLNSALVAAKKCVVLERSSLDHVLSEIKLGLTGAITDQSAAKIGNLLGAKLIVTGSVEQNESAIHVFTRLVNVETGQIESSAETFFSILPKVSDKTREKESSPDNKNMRTPIKSSHLFFEVNEEEDIDPIGLVYMKLMNGIFINIDKERNILHDQIVIIEEKEKINPTPELPAEKSRLTNSLRACDIMIKGVDAMIQNQDDDTFLACFKQAKELSPHNPNLMLFDSFYTLGDNGAFKKKIDAVLSISSTSAEAYLFRALFLDLVQLSEEKKIANKSLSEIRKEENGNKKILENIMTDLDRYALYSGDVFGAHSVKIHALLNLKKEKEADNLIKKAVSENPGNYTLYGVRAYYYARDFLITVRIFSTRWAEYTNNLGKSTAYETNRKDIDKAIEDFSVMIALDPSGILGRYERAMLYCFYKNNFDKAVSDLNTLIQIDPANAWRYLYFRGEAYKQLGKNEEMKKDWITAIEKNPKNIKALEAMKIIFKNEANYNDYMDFCSRMVTIEQQKTRPDYNRIVSYLTDAARFLAEKGQCENALEFYEKAFLNQNISMSSNEKMQEEFLISKTVWKIYAMEFGANCYKNSRQFTKAIEKYEDAIGETMKIKDKLVKLKPGSYTTIDALYFSVADLYEELGKYREAIASYGNGISSSARPPDSSTGASYFLRALCYEKVGDLENVKSDMKKSCSLGSQEACDYLNSH